MSQALTSEVSIEYELALEWHRRDQEALEHKGHRAQSIRET